MGETNRKRRAFVIRQKRHQREKINKLLEKYRSVRSQEEKQKIAEKIQRVSLRYTVFDLGRLKGA